MYDYEVFNVLLTDIILNKTLYIHVYNLMNFEI